MTANEESFQLVESRTPKKKVHFNEKEWEHLLSVPLTDSEEEPAQKYGEDKSPADITVAPAAPMETTHEPIISRGAATRTSFQNGSSTGGNSYAHKLSEFEQMKLAEEQKAEEKKRPNIKRKILKVVVTLMFITMAVGVIIIWSLHDSSGKDRSELRFYFDPEDLQLFLSRFDKDTSIGKLGGGGFLARSADDLDKCSVDGDSESLCYHWGDNNNLTMTQFSINEVRCYNISWSTLPTVFPEDCFTIDSGYWYGNMVPTFPSSFRMDRNILPFGMSGEGRMRALEYLWVSSKGVGIYLLNDGPYVVSWNTSDIPHLCFSPAYETSDVVSKRNMTYLVCQGYNAKETFQAFRKFCGNVASKNNISESFHSAKIDIIWSMKENVLDNDSVSDAVQFLNDNNFKCSILELPSTFGSTFDSQHYLSNITTGALSVISKEQNCQLMLPIHPFCSVNSPEFLLGLENGYFLLDSFSKSVKLLPIANETVALWDVTNRFVMEKLAFELGRLTSEFGINYFKLLNFPDIYEMISSDRRSSINSHFYAQWLKLLSEDFDVVFVQDIYRNQRKLLYIEIPSHVETIENTQCLTTTLSYALTASMFGFNFLTSSPANMQNWSEDIFLRWLQVSAFFPSLSIPTSVQRFSDETISYIHNITEFRQNFVLPRLTKFRNATHQVSPILRPIFWLEPLDDKSYPIQDQFFFGRDVLVIPVMCSGVRTRDVYLPRGNWRDPVLNVDHQGEQWITGVEIGLHTIKYYILVDRWPEVDRDTYDLN